MLDTEGYPHLFLYKKGEAKKESKYNLHKNWEKTLEK